MSALTIVIQWSTVLEALARTTKQEKEREGIEMREDLFLLAGNTTVYVENSKEATKKFLQL